MANTTHLAYTDESHHNTGRFRAIGMISLRAELALEINEKIQALNQQSDVQECKWYRLKTAKDRFAIQKVVELCLEYADSERLRIDVLVWDSKDNRHKVIGRDDNKNLMNMYIQLLKNVIVKRWKGNGVWQIFPDRNTIIDWHHVLNILRKIDAYSNDADLLLDKEWNQFRSLHSTVSIEEADSKLTGLCQAIDIFAGMGVFSYEKKDMFNDWKYSKSPQQELFALERNKLSKKDCEQSTLLDYFLQMAATTQIKFDITNGLKSKDPNQVINFWFYIPQRPSDKAPIREKF